MEDIEKLDARKLMEEEFNEIPDSLKVFATNVLGGFPTSEAAVERGFSKHKAIHWKFRVSWKMNLSKKFSQSERTCFTSRKKKLKKNPIKPFYN